MNTGRPPGRMVSREGALVAAGAAVTTLFHLFLGVLLFAAGTASRAAPLPEVREEDPAAPARRGRQAETGARKRRHLEGPWHRGVALGEERFDRRLALLATSRRTADQAVNFPFRSLACAEGRRGSGAGLSQLRRGLDFGHREDEVLQAMLIPALGLKKDARGELPRLVKYEQPEKFENAVNIGAENPTPVELRKADRAKKEELDRRRKKKPTLGELLDAPEDDDPRKRASQLSEIIGRVDGSVHGSGSEGQAGDVYLGRIEMSLRQSFVVPVFLTEDELQKLRVDVMIVRLDASGHVLEYRVSRKSGSPAFDGAALDAVRRFVPAEGGSKVFPEPPADMLDLINRRGVLVRLEGRKLR